MRAASRVVSLSRNRHAVRRFADRPVPDDLLHAVLECGRWAPSAREDQPWRFVVVREALPRHRLAAACFHTRLVRDAGALIVACARIHSHVAGHGRPSHPVDVAAAVQAMVLGAADLGLSTRWVTGFREPAVRELLHIPADVPVIAVLALGYPDGLDSLPPRRPAGETVAWERWREVS